MIAPDPQISVRHQCELLEVCRGSYYYQCCPETEENLALMRRLGYDDITTYAQGGWTPYLNGSEMNPEGGQIGMYSFDITAENGVTINTPFWTTCISPNGVLNGGQFTYDFETFSQASPGLNPASWSPTGGIENANYIFNTFSGQLLGGGILSQTGTSLAEQGAAMTLSMYYALYESTGAGTLNPMGSESSGFYIPGLAGDADVLADFNADIGSLENAKSIPDAAGYVLVPTPVPEA